MPRLLCLFLFSNMKESPSALRVSLFHYSTLRSLFTTTLRTASGFNRRAFASWQWGHGSPHRLHTPGDLYVKPRGRRVRKWAFTSVRRRFALGRLSMINLDRALGRLNTCALRRGTTIARAGMMMNTIHAQLLHQHSRRNAATERQRLCSCSRWFVAHSLASEPRTLAHRVSCPHAV